MMLLHQPATPVVLVIFQAIRFALGDDIIADDTAKNDSFTLRMSALQKKVFTNYFPDSRPVVDQANRIDVRVSLTVYHIEEINELDMTMKIHGYLLMYWIDEFLTWSTDDGSQEYMDVSSIHIWRPDIYVYNSASGKDDYHLNAWYPLRVLHTGGVLMWPPSTFEFTCNFDFSDFPYDEQVCVLILTSAKYPATQVDFFWLGESANMRLSFDDKTKQHIAGWQLIGNWTAKYYDDDVDAMATVRSNTSNAAKLYAYFKFRRHVPYFNVVFVLPAIVCAILTLTAMVCYESTEAALFLLLLNLILQAVFTRALMLKLPPSVNALPKIVQYFAFNLGMTFIGAILLATRMAFANLKTQTLVPERLKTISEFVSRYSLRSAIASATSPSTKRKHSKLVEESGEEGRSDKNSFDQHQRQTDIVATDWPTVIAAFREVCASFFVISYVIAALALLAF